jgi:hypothetical protein
VSEQFFQKSLIANDDVVVCDYDPWWQTAAKLPVVVESRLCSSKVPSIGLWPDTHYIWHRLQKAFRAVSVVIVYDPDFQLITLTQLCKALKQAKRYPDFAIMDDKHESGRLHCER